MQESQLNVAPLNEEVDLDGLYYDFEKLQHELPSGLESLLGVQPRTEFIWIHVSCILWTKEVYFEDNKQKAHVKGLENVAKVRFGTECSLCSKSTL